MTKKILDGYEQEFKYNTVGQLIEYTDESDKKTYYSYYTNGLRENKNNMVSFDYHNSEYTYKDFYYDQNGRIIYEYHPEISSTSDNVWYRWNAFNPVYSSAAPYDNIVSNHRGDIVSNFEHFINGYGAYGVKERETKENSMYFGFCGEYTDEESGLVYLRNRYYDPEIGRFITEDPAKDGDNWYAYCAGNPVSYIDPSGLYYLIAWSYGPKDLASYTDNNGNVDWDSFTKENSFARAAYTRKKDLMDMGIPEKDIDIQRIDNEYDMRQTWKMWSGYDIVEGLNIYSHGYEGDIIIVNDRIKFLANTTKLNWGSKWRERKIDGKTVAIAEAPYAVFHGCDTANGSLAQSFANTQGVRTYAQAGSASFSRLPDIHIRIKDGARSGKVYLYHFNVLNLKNTNGWGKVFYKQ